MHALMSEVVEIVAGAILLLPLYLAIYKMCTLTPFFCHCSVDRNKYQIQIPLPPKIDPSVTMMTVEEKPDVTYNDVGGCKEQIEKMREVSYILISPLLYKFVAAIHSLSSFTLGPTIYF